MNKQLKKLGFSNTDRVLIIHADDIGMCHATIPAFAELAEFGLVTSGSIMPPCPWLPAVINQFEANTSLDLGIHLTLTSEWRAYRWRGVTNREETNDLLDPHGYFYASREELHQVADVHSVGLELRAQINRITQMGLKPTHIDSHMFALIHPLLFTLYVELCLELNLPALIWRADWCKWGFNQQQTEQANLALMHLQEAELPIFDNFYVLGKNQPGISRLQQVENIINQLPVGLSILLIHPAQDTPELRATMPNWDLRVSDYETFLKPSLKEKIDQSPVVLIQYKELTQHAFR